MEIREDRTIYTLFLPQILSPLSIPFPPHNTTALFACACVTLPNVVNEFQTYSLSPPTTSSSLLFSFSLPFPLLSTPPAYYPCVAMPLGDKHKQSQMTPLSFPHLSQLLLSLLLPSIFDGGLSTRAPLVSVPVLICRFEALCWPSSNLRATRYILDLLYLFVLIMIPKV